MRVWQLDEGKFKFAGSHHLPLGPATAGAINALAVSSDGAWLWFSDRFGDTVRVLAIRFGRIVRRIRVGIDLYGLAYFPQPGRYSLGHNGVYR